MLKITKVERELNDINITVEGINHIFAFNMTEFNNKEDLLTTLGYAVSAYKKQDCTTLYNEIKSLENK